MQITTYKEAVNYLETFIGKVLYKIDKEYLKHHDPLERMRVLLDLFGNPQNKFQSVLVGGTAGKGSTAYLISHILTTAGYRTGLTISPHLQKINERIQINGDQISDQKFTNLLASILSSIEGMKKILIGAPSYFEIIVAMAFKYFFASKVDIAVVEVGMGGEYDATNTLYPLIAVLTNVSLDHTNILGGTVQKIARTKVGIIKKIEDLRFKIYESSKNRKSSIINHKSIAVTGVKQPSVIKIVEDRCKEVGAEVFRLGKDLPDGRQGFNYKIKKESLGGSVFDLISQRDRVNKLNGLKLSLLGKHQVENASLAIETVLQLERFGFRVSEKQIREGLKTAFFPGRFEVIRCHPEFISGSVSRRMLKQVQHDNETTLILDGAHNPTKMRAFLSALQKLYPNNPKVFIIAFKNDKNIKGMLGQILKVADKVIVTEFKAKTDLNLNASADALKLKTQNSKLKDTKKVVVVKDSKKALDKALAIQRSDNSAIIVVTGSLYLVGEVRSML